MITLIWGHSPPTQVLKEGDVLTHFNGHSVADDGTFLFDFHAHTTTTTPPTPSSARTPLLTKPDHQSTPLLINKPAEQTATAMEIISEGEGDGLEGSWPMMVRDSDKQQHDQQPSSSNQSVSSKQQSLPQQQMEGLSLGAGEYMFRIESRSG